MCVRVPLLEIKLRYEMSKRSLVKAVHSVNRAGALSTIAGEQDEQPEEKKVLVRASSARPIRLCAKCKSILVMVPTSLVKEASDYGVSGGATSSDECSCYCHVIYARMKARLGIL
jgi:hypothetical protein